MQVRLAEQAAEDIDADAVIVGAYSENCLTEPAAAIDKASDGLLSKLQQRKEITGKELEIVPIYSPPGVSAPLVLVVGLGDQQAPDCGVAFRAAGAAAKFLAAKQRTRVAFYWPTDWGLQFVENAVAGAIVGCTGQDLFRTEKNLHPPETMLVSADQQAVETGRILGEAMNLTRELVNLPAGDMYPESFASRAEEVAGQNNLTLEVWDKARLQQERCGALLGVAQGSARDPRMVILDYNGAAADAPILALVGKGVTFDSGGLSLKSSDGMKTMKCDMAGAATVLGAMQAIAQLKLPVHVVGLMGLVENMTGPAAYKLGDVLRSRQGTTIEVLNTDAEGRLVLADVLDVAVTRGATQIIDLATLTGAVVVALGLDVTGLMTNDQAFCEEIASASQRVGERTWQLPMFAEYDKQIESKVADIKNVGEGRWGGAITAAKLLQRFVGDSQWTHIDIAGEAFRDSEKTWCDAGGSGVMVRTLVELLRSRSAP